jgi:hypothetical protein
MFINLKSLKKKYGIDLLIFSVGVICIIICILAYRIYKNVDNMDNTASNTDSKIAFLFLTIDNLKNPTIWEDYFKGNENKYTIYCHPKNPEKVTDKLLKNNIISEKYETGWGTFGTVQSNIAMIKAALQDTNNQRFVLISQSCMPINSFDNFYNFIMKNDTSYFADYTLDELKNTDIDKTFYNEYDIRYLMIINPKFPYDKFTKHSAQGLVFNRKHATILVDTILSNTPNWKNVRCVDEHYFGNVLHEQLGDNFKNEVTPNEITFDHWRLGKLTFKHQNNRIKSWFNYDELSYEFIINARENNYFFIRKVETLPSPTNFSFIS